MSTQSVVYICAHPDDITSVAGTLALLRRKGPEPATPDAAASNGGQA